MAQQYVRLDKISSAGHIETTISTEDLRNGQFVELGAIDESQGGEAVVVEKAEQGALVEALITTPHIDYGNTDYDIREAVTKAGKAGRAHIIQKGDIVSFLQEEVIANGSEVAIGAGGFGVKLAEEGEEVIGKVIATEYQANIGDLTVVRFK